jgi:hypothetical protein
MSWAQTERFVLYAGILAQQGMLSAAAQLLDSALPLREDPSVRPACRCLSVTLRGCVCGLHLALGFVCHPDLPTVKR